MKLFEKKKFPNGKREIYFLNRPLFHYKKRLSAYDKIYAKRFTGLTEKEARFILRHQFKHMMGRSLNLDNPQTFNEKIQWMKLYCRDPRMTLCADKYKVRDYIKQQIGEKYLTPLLGVYDNAEEIDFDKLPNRFVAKVNWGSGQNIICTDKTQLDIAEVKRKLNMWMQPHSNHYYNLLEWVYKDIEPKIIIEEYLESLSHGALDYKFMCFNGKPYYIWVSNKYLSVQERSFYDLDWNMLDMELVEPHKIKAPKPAPRPDNLLEMIELARKLCQGFAHVRVDLYKLDDGTIKFGELTFSTSSGYSPWSPKEVDKKLGDLLDLNLIKKDVSSWA